jgi:hypothetical protein
MTGPADGLRDWPAAAIDGWREFWFRPQPAYTLGLIRIAFGALAVVWTLSLLPNLFELVGEHGVAPHHPLADYRWGVFELWRTDLALLIGWLVLLVSAVALTLGWHSRLAAVVVFVLILSFDRRNPFVFNSGDALFRIEALFLALAPAGAALSLDQRRTTGAFWSARECASWPTRLMQVQLSLIYLSTIQWKLTGDSWPQGTAVSYALRLDDMLIIPIPQWITMNALVMNVATWSTLALELAIGILVWNHRLRPWLLAAGVAMHLMIMLTINVGFFSLAMFVLYVAFLPPETVQRLPGDVRRLSARAGRVRR